MVFEYDPKKAKTNWQKHGVSFAEAEMVFFDLLAIHDRKLVGRKPLALDMGLVRSGTSVTSQNSF